ncbi:MAG: hypothetical protein B7X06_00010 [Verrucomicrobia bacterium 21-51-4]|nr:MAG: hypothetical protein B7X06_00010 [Verrucomicrobia bacterium 21-51-4]HQU08340.1 DUF2000 domain-containing protein [Opitutales bacterium]
MSFENKMVAIINKEVDIGVAMNAVAHASIAMGGRVGTDALQIAQYKDASDNLWPISAIPYIILRGKSSEIRKAITQAKEQNVQQITFLETMTGGGYIEQMDRTALLPEEPLVYFAAVLFGPWDAVSQITKKLSLYK